MRRFGRALVPALCLLFIAANACAQAPYPSKPIRIIVPYAPGGLTDVVARLYSEQLRHRLGRGVFIENKPGASGIIAIEEMARAKTRRLHHHDRQHLDQWADAGAAREENADRLRTRRPDHHAARRRAGLLPRDHDEFPAHHLRRVHRLRQGASAARCATAVPASAAISRSTPRSSPSERVSTSCTSRSRAAAPRSSAISPTATSRCRGSTSPIRSA